MTENSILVTMSVVPIILALGTKVLSKTPSSAFTVSYATIVSRHLETSLTLFCKEFFALSILILTKLGTSPGTESKVEFTSSLNLI